MPARNRLLRLLPWLLAAYIFTVFVWYLQYKWTANPGSVFLFQTLADWSGIGAFEPWGRIGVGAAELGAALLLLVPATQAVGAALAVGIMSGAIFFHLFTPLGIDPYMDGGKLFTEACLVLASGLAILFLRRDRVRRLYDALRWKCIRFATSSRSATP